MTSNATGMSDFTSALATSFSESNIWGAITPLIPFIAIVTFVALGFGLFKKYRNRLKNTK